MSRFLQRLLNLHPGDLGHGLLLFSYLFLIMSSYVVARVARDTLFLDKFEAVQLPYVDIAIALLVGFVVAGYIRLSRRASLRALLIGSLLFFASNAVGFWWLAHAYQWPWLYPVFYVWVGIFGVLAPAQVWTLANYVLTTREAKRVFGLVGSGAILGAIFGGKFSNAVAPNFGTESLLLAIAVSLAASAGLASVITREQRSAPQQEEGSEETSREPAPRNLRQSLRMISESRYLVGIAALILIASLVTSIAGWQFKAISKEFIPEKDSLAAFFGAFYFYAGIACLLVQLLLTARFLRRFGLGAALFVVPLALLAASAGLLLSGALWAAIALRGSINVFQYSIDKSTVELLYLPVPANVKVQVKSFIDTVIWRFGDGLAALVVLIFATYLNVTAQQVSWINVVFTMGWLAAAFVASRQYVVMLSESIRQHRLDAEQTSAPVLDRSSAEMFATNLNASEAHQILYALSLFEVSREQAVHPAVRGLLRHPTPIVRQKAISVLAVAGDKTVLPQIEGLLRDPQLEVRTEALLYLSQHSPIHPSEWIRRIGDLPDSSIRSGLVAFLARSGETQSLETARLVLDSMVEQSGPEGKRTRLEAARLIGVLPDQFDDQLRLLLTDPDAAVVRQAIAAVGKLRKRRFIPSLLDKLTDPDCGLDVTEALASFGDRIVGTLRDYLSDPTVPMDVRREIPNVLLYIGTPTAERVLLENMLQCDTTLRFHIISSLNKLQQSHPEINLDRQMIETVLAVEILGHYRSYQILQTLGGNLKSDKPEGRALRKSMNQEVERIFRVLGLLFPRLDLYSAYFGLQSNNAVVRANALEFLDNILRPQMRNLLVPLLDKEVSIAERVQRASHLVGGTMENCEEEVTALVYSEDSWLKSCGAYAIGTLGLKSLESELDKYLNHSDPVLRETARQAKLRLEAL